MKAILEFDLEDHDQKMAHLRCVKALNMAICLWELDQELRNIDKYDKPYDIESLREKFWDCLGDNNVNLEELIN